MISVTIMNSTVGSLEYTTNAYKASGYYGLSEGIHTVQIRTNDFTGRIWIEGSLATSPTERDWFPISLNGATPYIELPVEPLAPNDIHGDTKTLGYSFKANIVWIRARLDRSYIVNPNLNIMGFIDSIIVSF